MDLSVLKRKLSTYETDTGRLVGITDELLYEIVTAWEQWTGTGVDFYKKLGYTKSQMAPLVGKAKRLKREGHFGTDSFKEITIEGTEVSIPNDSSCVKIELQAGPDKVIRFPHVDMLIDYLKKVG